MNGAHLHLILNHIPVVGVGLGFVLLMAGMFGKKEAWIKASWFLFILSGLVAIPAYLSGHEAEEVIEHLPGVSEDAIGPHAMMAFYAFVGSLVLAALTLLFWVLSRGREVAMWMVNLSLVLAIAIAGLFSYTAMLGGEIHHPEIRKGFQAPPDTDEGNQHHHD